MISFIRRYKNRIEGSEIAKRFLGGAVWSVFGTLISSGITLVMWMVVARLMGKESYGQLVVVQSTLAMVGVFAGFGIGAAATRYAAELKTRDPIRLGHILTLAERSILLFGALGTFTLIACSEWIASNVLNRSSLSLPLSIAAGTVFFTALDAYQKSVLIGVESMRAYAMGTILGVLISVPIMIYAVHKYELIGATFGLLISAGIQAFVSRFQINKELKRYNVRRDGHGCLSESAVLWRFALPALLAGALVGPAHWAAQAILANQPSGFAELAVLGVALQWFNVIGFIPGAAGRVLLPMLTDHVVESNHTTAAVILNNSMRVNFIVLFPIAVFLIALSPYVMSLYALNHSNSALVLSISIATSVLISILSPISSLVAATSKMWIGVLMNAAWAVIYVSSSYIFSKHGSLGIIISLAIAYIFHSIWTYLFFRGYLINTEYKNE